MQTLATILVVDPDPDLREAVKTVLEDHLHGERVMVAASADSALRILRDHAVQVIVLDHHMPGSTGLRFLAAVEREWPAIPNIIMTTSGMETIRELGADAQGRRMLQKPFDASALLAEVREALAAPIPMLA